MYTYVYTNIILGTVRFRKTPIKINVTADAQSGSRLPENAGTHFSQRKIPSGKSSNFHEDDAISRHDDANAQTVMKI